MGPNVNRRNQGPTNSLRVALSGGREGRRERGKREGGKREEGREGKPRFVRPVVEEGCLTFLAVASC